MTIGGTNNYKKTNSEFLPAPNAFNVVSFFFSSSIQSLFHETMRRRPRATFLLSFLFLVLFAVFSIHHLSRTTLSSFQLHSDVHRRPTLTARILNENEFPHPHRRVSSINFKDSILTTSVLIPDWEILLVVSPNTPSPPPSNGDHHFHCLFRNNDRTPAKFSGVLPFTNRTTFKCALPESARRRRVFNQPALMTSSSENEPPDKTPAPELLRWNFLVYESFSTDDDVVLFAKGVNTHPGHDRSPDELRCVFGLRDGDRDAVRTAITSSVQEVFRCAHPDPSELGPDSDRIGIFLEIVADNIVVPSLAYYTPRPNMRPNSPAAEAQPKHVLCACTMVYNVAKFLREWVMYHSKVGVDNFLLYDNGSDDDLERVVAELRREGYNITTLFWIWPKTQEGGFSHSVLFSKSKDMCKWIMYVDVDEFVFSPSWINGNNRTNNNRLKHEILPSLKSLLPHRGEKIGQVSIQCLEFGPSGQRIHPAEGVTQGYTCRRRVEQRHKSVVLVEAVDPSLWNVVHHFRVKDGEGFGSKQLGLEEGVVNHYKYQAWDEFKTKFRRRVSAYVVDWRRNMNANSKDRTPGLGFEAVEPPDWAYKFCEVQDHRLKSLAREWFGSSTRNRRHRDGYRMAWQST